MLLEIPRLSKWKTEHLGKHIRLFVSNLRLVSFKILPKIYIVFEIRNESRE